MVIVNGGCEGMGLLVAEELARRGCRIALSSPDREMLDVAGARLAAVGTETYLSTCDVGDSSSAEDFVDEVERTFGRIDMVVNAARVVRLGRFGDDSIEDAEDAFRSGFLGPIHVTLRALRRLGRDGNHARVLNVTTTRGAVGLHRFVEQAVPDLGLASFGHSLRAELAGQERAPKVMSAAVELHEENRFDDECVASHRAQAHATVLLRAVARVVDAARDGEHDLRISTRVQSSNGWRTRLPRWFAPSTPGGASALAE